VKEPTNQIQEAADPAPPGSHEGSPDPLRIDPLKEVQGWVGALTLASLLVAVGFISRISREQFLGMPPGQWDVSSLSLSAGRCLVDSLLIPIGFLSGHPYSTAAGASALLCFPLAGWALRGRRSALEWFRFGLLGAVGLSLALVLLRYELPTVPLTNWLIAGPPELPCQISTPPTGNTLQLLFLRKTANGCATRTAQVLVASKLDYDFDNSVVGVLYQFEMTPDQARDAVNRYYSVAVLICLLGWLWFLLSLPLRRLTVGDQFFSLLSTVVFMLLVLATGFVPYMYGKLIQSTVFPEAEVSFREAAPNSTQEKVTSDDFAVVSKGDKSLSLVAAKPGVFRIVEVPLERVLYIHVYGTIDPFAIRLKTLVPAKG
jgi:hypothetical protein